MNPRNPIYIVSKGRWDSIQTAKALDAMKVPYRLVVEDNEYEHYARECSCGPKLLRLPFYDLGMGSVPARNWIWEHSLKEGHAHHWILDDNICCFHRVTQGVRRRVLTGAIFAASEDFCDRFDNVALAGLNYSNFVLGGHRCPPFYLNTRIYSCIRIRNDLPYRWRGLYNEDTDLSIRVLKDGWCTILFNAFTAKKAATMTMKGGNTDVLYSGDGRLRMAQSLVSQHPDVASITKRYGRYHHLVNYSSFVSELRYKHEAVVPDEGINEYGMVLK